MSNEIAVYNPLPLAEVERMADYVAKSGMFGIKTKEGAVALMMLAQAEGMHPMIAARDYDIIQGKPSKKAEAMLRDFHRAGGKVEWHQLDDTKADATFSHPQGGSFRCVWDMDRAKKAGLGGKEMWVKWTRQMLRSRCVSEGCKTVWPNATSGMYTPEEQEDISGPAPMRDVTPPKPQRDTTPLPPVHEEQSQERQRAEFELISSDGEIRTFDKASDYLAGLRSAFDEMPEDRRDAWWADNVEPFNELHSRFVQAGKNKAAIAAFDETSKHINSALAGKAA